MAFWSCVIRAGMARLCFVLLSLTINQSINLLAYGSSKAGVTHKNNVVHTINCLSKNKRVFESVSLCEYACQFVGRSQLMNNGLVSCSWYKQIVLKTVFWLVDGLIKQSFGLLLTSCLKTVQVQSRTLITVLSTSNNDLTSLLLNCFKYSRQSRLFAGVLGERKQASLWWKLRRRSYAAYSALGAMVNVFDSWYCQILTSEATNNCEYWMPWF